MGEHLFGSSAAHDVRFMLFSAQHSPENAKKLRSSFENQDEFLIEAELLEHSFLGAGLLVLGHFECLHVGDLVGYSVSIGKLEPVRGVGLICSLEISGAHAEQTSTRIGVKFVESFDRDSGFAGLGRRSEKRREVPRIFAPLCICDDPIRFGERIYLEVKDLTASGMKVYVSSVQSFFTLSMRIELTMSFPFFGSHQLFAQVTHIRLCDLTGLVVLGLKFLMSGHHFTSALQAFMQYFLEPLGSVGPLVPELQVSEHNRLFGSRSLNLKRGFVHDGDVFSRYMKALFELHPGGLSENTLLENACVNARVNACVNARDVFHLEPICSVSQYLSQPEKRQPNTCYELLWSLHIQQGIQKSFQRSFLGSASLCEELQHRLMKSHSSYTLAHGFLFDHSLYAPQMVEEAVIFSALVALVAGSEHFYVEWGGCNFGEQARAENHMKSLGFVHVKIGPDDSSNLWHVSLDDLLSEKQVGNSLWNRLMREARAIEPHVFRGGGAPSFFKRLFLRFSL